MRILVLLLCLLGVAQAEWSVVEPAVPVAGQPGERVLVRVQGPKNQSPFLKLGGATKTVKLVEGPPGEYSAYVRLPRTGSRALLFSETITELRRNLGQLQVLEQDKLWTATTETVTRQGPHPDYDRLTPLYKGQQVVVDGYRGGWLRCRSSGTWVDARGSEPLELEDGSTGPNRLRRVVIEEAKNGDALLRLTMNRPNEVQAVHDPVTETLRLQLPHTYQTNFDIKRPSGVAEFLGPIKLRPQSSPLGVELSVSSSEITGYQVEPGSPFTIRLRKPLPKSLQGLRVTVDAGHGGPEDKGTVGHRGLQEKTLNLRVAKALAKMLSDRGAEVVMTRTTDTDVASLGTSDGGELQARVDRSIAEGSQLFLSVHHNARPSIEQGKVYHGTDIYWYQPHSQPLAKALADPIADAIGEPTRSFRWRSFFVIRQTHSPAVLMEFQYLSNPRLEESVLSQPDYAKKAASGVVEGLVNYLKEH